VRKRRYRLSVDRRPQTVWNLRFGKRSCSTCDSGRGSDLRSGGPVRRSCIGGSEWLPVVGFGGHSPARPLPAAVRAYRPLQSSAGCLVQSRARNQSGMPSIVVLRHRRRFGVLGRRETSQSGISISCFPLSTGFQKPIQPLSLACCLSSRQPSI